MNEKPSKRPAFVEWLSRRTWRFWLASAPVLYALSSGPVMAIAFSLRDTTHHDGWYAVLLAYYPLLILDEKSPAGLLVRVYLGWWCWLFNTLPPG